MTNEQAYVESVVGVPSSPLRQIRATQSRTVGRPEQRGLAELTAETVEALVEFAGPHSDCQLASMEIRHLGGALDKAPRTPDAIPVRGRSSPRWSTGCGPGRKPDAWSVSSRQTRQPARAMREIYGPELYDRLARIKREHDPANIFRVNHNIEPA